MLQRLLKIFAWGWLVVVGGLALLTFLVSTGGGEHMAALVGILIGCAPLGLMFWAGQARKTRWASVHAEMLAAAGGSAVAFEHGEEDSGIAVNPKSRTVTLSHAGSWKTYSYDDVRKWRTTLVRPGMVGAGANMGTALAAVGAEVRMRAEAAADTGLFVDVRDVDRPKWRIAMRSEAVQARWMEILNQEVNESRPASAHAPA